MVEKQHKVFMSYGHKNEELVERVSTDLMNAGIEVLLDTWDLNPGDDLNYYMEQSVNNASVEYVIIFCDGEYKEKADKRDGSGVSTETTIMSPAVYKSTQNSRFIPIVSEYDESGCAVIPTFLNSKTYINFCSDRPYSEAIDELERWIYKEPIKKNPALGQKPDFSVKQITPEIAKLRSISMDIMRVNDNPKHMTNLFRNDFLDQINVCLIKWISGINEGEFDVNQLNSSTMIVDEFIKVYAKIGAETDSGEISSIITFFNEYLALYDIRGEYRKFEVYCQYVAYQLFLICGSVLIKNDNLGSLKKLSNMKLSFGGSFRGFETMYPGEFVRRTSPEDWIPDNLEKSYNKRDFKYVIEFDLFLYYYSEAGVQGNIFWYPLTWIKWKESDKVFSLFNRLDQTDGVKEVQELFSIESEERKHVITDRL